jgi:hypothetical protein
MILAKVVQADLKYINKYTKGGPQNLLADRRYAMIAEDLSAFIVKLVNDLEYTK